MKLLGPERECEDGCPTQISESERQKFTACLERLSKRRRLDWSNVKTTEDLILILSTLFGDATIAHQSDEERKLERFLEPKKENS